MSSRVRSAIVATAAVGSAAFFGARFSPADEGISRWYGALEKPPFNPPDWVFGPAWTLLYVLMIVSYVRISGGGGESLRRQVQALWWAQLALNAAWTPLFFGAKKPALALADLVALLVVAGLYTARARRVDRPAAWLFAPYLAWVAFAGVLNLEIVRRNAV